MLAMVTESPAGYSQPVSGSWQVLVPGPGTGMGTGTGYGGVAPGPAVGTWAL